MAEYQVGEIVDITITGARVIDQKHASLGFEYVSVPDDDPEEVVYVRTSVDTRSSAVNVARVAPAEWPPQPGDVWSLTGKQYWAIGSNASDVRLMGASGASWNAEELLQRSVSVKLVHREDRAEVTP